MPTYLMLLRWTTKGIENVKQSPKRLDQAKKAIEGAGGRMTAFYMTMGRYDMALTVEAPDDATLATVGLALGAQGAVQSETLRAFTEDEYRKIIGSLP